MLQVGQKKQNNNNNKKKTHEIEKSTFKRDTYVSNIFLQLSSQLSWARLMAVMKHSHEGKQLPSAISLRCLKTKDLGMPGLVQT